MGKNDKIPSYSKIKMVGSLIREAVSLGILTDNEDHKYVYLQTQLPSGSYVWQAYPILEACLDLIRSENVELLENAVKEEKLKRKGKKNA